MNYYQARCALTAGKKVAHQHFTDKEYLELKDGRTITEDGYSMPLTTYNPWSSFAAPDGWKIYEPEKSDDEPQPKI